MIKLLLSLILIILIIVFFWRYFTVQPLSRKKVKFSESVEEIEHLTPAFDIPSQKPQGPEKLNLPDNVQKSLVALSNLVQPDDRNNNLVKLNQVYSEINPSNFYTQNYNTPNFVSDNAQQRQYYAYDLPPNDKPIPIPTEPFFKSNNNQNSSQLIDQANTDPPWLVPAKQPKNGLEWQSDYWSYKNEIPMNGGIFGGIVGYEELGPSYSLFYNKDSNDIVQEQEVLLKRNDDLRNGLGVPQKQEFLYNMSQN